MTGCPMQKKDLTGQRFGRLVVLSEADAYIPPSGHRVRCWNCVCDCGTHLVVRQNLLTCTHNPTRSCGCLLKEFNRRNAQDLTGQRFGRLLVLGPVELPRPRHNGTRLGWRCRCDCGKEIITTQVALADGKRSCGCLTVETAQKRMDTLQDAHKFDGTDLQQIRPTRPLNKNNTSGVTGVYWSTREGCWIAKIHLRYKTITLGRFSSFDEAAAARKAAEEEYYSPILEAAEKIGKK